MRFIRSTWRLFSKNAKTIILFELFIKGLAIGLIAPLAAAMLDGAVLHQGYAYLADTNLVQFATSPVTWILLFIAVLILACFGMFEIASLSIVFEASRRDIKMPLRTLIVRGAAQTRRLADPSNYGFIIFICLLVPLSQCIMITTAVADFHVPEFITEWIFASPLFTVLYVALGMAIIVFVLRWAFSPFFFALFDMDFKEAHRTNVKLLKGRVWYFVSRIIAWNIFVAVVSLIGVLAQDMFVEWITPLLDGSDSMTLVILALLSSLVFMLIYLAAICLATPLSFAVNYGVFTHLLEENGMEVPYEMGELSPKHRKHGRLSMVAVSVVLVIAVASVLFGQVVHLDDSAVEEDTNGDGVEETTCLLTAHRGASKLAPENTLEAFQAAIDENADWIEMDVQELKDGTLIIMHDSNFKRTTGVDLNVWDATWDDVKDLDSGSWFGPEWSSVRICTLDQALDLCKGKINMNIEVKPSGHESDLETKTVDTINAHDMRDQVAVASISHDSLSKVKAHDPQMRTLYNMTIAVGLITDIGDVDIYAVDEAFITSRMVEDVHGDGKLIFAWTVDDSSNMLKLTNLGIDSLVTNDVPTARTIVESQDGISAGDTTSS